MTLHETAEFYTQWLNVCPNITITFCTIAIFKSSIQENNDSNKNCRYVHDLSKCNGS
jgi:hypothetical protein